MLVLKLMFTRKKDHVHHCPTNAPRPGQLTAFLSQDLREQLLLASRSPAYRRDEVFVYRGGKVGRYTLGYSEVGRNQGKDGVSSGRTCKQFTPVLRNRSLLLITSGNTGHQDLFIPC